ncbi:MAG TPA: transglutaminase family protein [Polyangiaceae bacterium]
MSELLDWRDELHDRFALPDYLALDLQEVFADLDAAGLGLTPAVESMLLDRADGVLAVADFEGCCLQLEQALEFWPLVGDVASQEGGGSRLVDASTSRLQVLLSADGPDAEAKLDALQVSVNGHQLPFGSSTPTDPARRGLGLRYRSFVPWNGLHPALGAASGIHVGLRHASGRSLSVKLHPWRPSGEAYPGLPVDLDDAAARRLERAVASKESHTEVARERPPRAP